MALIRLVAVGAAALILALPAAARAQTVTTSPGVSNTYQGTDAPEEVTVSTSGAQTVFQATGLMGQCTATGVDRFECATAGTTIVTTLGGDDRIDASQLNAATTLQADGGAGGDYILDGAGNDSLSGGPGGDVWTAGPGRDAFSGGDGDDSVDYTNRSTPVTIRLDGTAVSGEAGEGDTVGADVEGAFGGTAGDSIVGNGLGNRLIGGPGNDAIVGGAAEDRVEGQEGDDVIDTRDGRFDSIDCGSGTDTLLADAGDTAVNCEIAPDRDGDGTPNEQDCAPDNAAIHPGAGEIVGNAVDEDCQGGPQYLRVTAPLSYTVARRQSRSQAKFVKLTLSEIKAGDSIELRCSGGKAKGCPFTRKTQTGKAGKAKVNLVALLKQRYLKRNAVLEVRVTRPNEIGRVLRLTVTKRGVIKSEALCLAVGATKPGKCV
jgi:hypothetical protein